MTVLETYFAVIQAGSLQPSSRRTFGILTLFIDRKRSVFFDLGQRLICLNLSL